jgi:hypothetical protein
MAMINEAVLETVSVLFVPNEQIKGVCLMDCYFNETYKITFCSTFFINCPLPASWDRIFLVWWIELEVTAVFIRIIRRLAT